MLVKTDALLYTDLQTRLLYQAGDFALDYTPDTAVDVVRYGSSEYIGLLEAQRPFIAVQYLQTRSHDIARPTLRRRQIPYWDHTDETQTESATNEAPDHRVVEYQLDIRAPYDLWLRQIESELDRVYSPIYEAEVQGRPLGDAVGDITFKVRFTFKAIARVPDLEDDLKERFFRSVYRVSAETWLLPSTDEMVLKKTYSSVGRFEIQSGDDPYTTESVLITELP